LDLSGLSAFLPPQIKSVKGSISAQGNGNVDLNLAKLDEPGYDFKVMAQGRAVEMEGLNISDMVQEVVGKVGSLGKYAKAIKEMNLDFFDTMHLKAQATPKVYRLEEFNLRGRHDDFVINGQGQVLPQGSSEIKMNLTLNAKVGPELKHAIGTNEVPLKLGGQGFALRPDYGHTVGGLAGKAAEYQVKKQGKKAVEKLGDKLLKGKGEKLLKGLFK